MLAVDVFCQKFWLTLMDVAILFKMLDSGVAVHSVLPFLSEPLTGNADARFVHVQLNMLTVH